jgi:hypothetical protein
MTTTEAIKLARSIKYGPLPFHTDPTPTAPEAIQIITDARANCGHQWITADNAIDVLKWHAAGHGQHCGCNNCAAQGEGRED